MTTPTAQQIIAAVADVFNLPIEHVKAGTKAVPHVRARWAAMLLITEIGKSASQTGQALRLINHTSVLHGVKKARQLQSENQDYANLILDARDLAARIAQGYTLAAKHEPTARPAPRPQKIKPCLNVVPFRPRRLGPKPWMTVDTAGEWPWEWYAENQARFHAAMSIAHPELIDWGQVSLRA